MDMAGNSTDSGRSVTSKVIAILQSFTNGGAHSLTELARLTALPVSTVHRLTTELALWGALERTGDGLYRLGLPLKAIGRQVSHAPAVHERARRLLDDLSAATRSTVRLGVLDDLAVAYLEKPAGHEVASTTFGKSTLPAHATALGKALLAFSPAHTTNRLLAAGLKQYTPYTLTTADQLRRALNETRARFVAVSRWEHYLGHSAVAVPVFGPGGIVVASLEISVKNLRAELRFAQPALFVAARSLSRDLMTGHALGPVSVGPDRRLAGPVSHRG
jgi:DNA-binding IclR family transcriptional regulator